MEERKPSEMFALLHDGIGGTAELGWQGSLISTQALYKTDFLLAIW